MEHKDAYELIDLHVFGLLDEDRGLEVDDHIRGCAECRQRAKEVGELMAAMASSVPQVDPPPRVKEALMRRVGGQPGVVDQAPESAGSPARSMRRLAMSLRISWATTAVAVVVAVFAMIQMSQLTEEVSTVNKVLNVTASEADRLRSELAILQRDIRLGEPGYRFVSLDGVDPNPNAFGHLVMKPDGASGVAYLYDFPVQPEGKTYQLWGMMSDHAMSIGTFTVTNNGTAVLKIEAIPEPDCIVSFRVTIEPSGGMPKPTGMLYVKGDNRFRDVH